MSEDFEGKVKKIVHIPINHSMFLKLLKIYTYFVTWSTDQTVSQSSCSFTRQLQWEFSEAPVVWTFKFSSLANMQTSYSQTLYNNENKWKILHDIQKIVSSCM